MAKKILITNKLKQGLPILLKNGEGKCVSAVLPSRGTRLIGEAEMSQDLTDKEARKYLHLSVVEEK